MPERRVGSPSRESFRALKMLFVWYLLAMRCPYMRKDLGPNSSVYYMNHTRTSPRSCLLILLELILHWTNCVGIVLGPLLFFSFLLLYLIHLYILQSECIHAKMYRNIPLLVFILAFGLFSAVVAQQDSTCSKLKQCHSGCCGPSGIPTVTR